MPEATTENAPQQAVEIAPEIQESASILNKSIRGRQEQVDELQQTLQKTFDLLVKQHKCYVPKNSVRSLKNGIAWIDRELSKQISKIIHHEDFQRLEGTWRGLHHLVYKTETDTMLKLKVMNISKRDLSKVVTDYPEAAFDQSPLFKKIYEEEYGHLGGRPFGAFIGDYYFDHSAEDVTLLEGVSKIAAACHAPFISGASPGLMNLDSWQQLNKPRDIAKIFDAKEYIPWKALRESDDARYLGLTFPRFLSRLPYGSKTLRVEGFDFEEQVEGGKGSDYAWSNAAYAMGANITKAFKLYGWCTQIRGVESGGAVEGLPCHFFPTTDGDSDINCPTEIGIPDRREKELADAGLIPLCYYKNTNKSVFMGAQSLNKPKKYMDDAKGREASASANLSSRLPYTFAVCRFAHYLKCMVRDKVGKLMEADELKTYLSDWIQNYVIANPKDANEELKAKRPLAGAQIEVKPIESNPGFYNAVFRLRPHFQLEGVDVSLRLVSKLKQGGG